MKIFIWTQFLFEKWFSESVSCSTLHEEMKGKNKQNKTKNNNIQSLSVQCYDIQGPLGYQGRLKMNRNQRIFVCFVSISMKLSPSQGKVCCFCHVKHTHMLSVGHFLGTERLKAICRGRRHPPSSGLMICQDPLWLLFLPHLHTKETQTN